MESSSDYASGCEIAIVSGAVVVRLFHDLVRLVFTTPLTFLQSVSRFLYVTHLVEHCLLS